MRGDKDAGLRVAAVVKKRVAALDPSHAHIVVVVE